MLLNGLGVSNVDIIGLRKFLRTSKYKLRLPPPSNGPLRPGRPRPSRNSVKWTGTLGASRLVAR